jgi:hypothetical protein
MGSALEISTLDVRLPPIPLEEFYNEPLNETIGTCSLLVKNFFVTTFCGG